MHQIAFVFPGQGSQSVGMGRALAEASPAAAAVFAAADAALGEPISRLAWEGPEEELNRTENSQPALLAASIAYLEAVRERWCELGIDVPEPAFAAGHSMGQYTALVAAGALDLADAVRLVRIRGQQMQASGAGREGRMAAVIGLDDERLPELVARASEHGVFGVANRNSPGQVVVSGERAAIEASLAIAKELGAKRAIELPVSVAAHSPLMADAAEAMRGRPRGHRLQGPQPAAARQRRRPGHHDRRRAAARSSSSTSPPASTGSAPSEAMTARRRHHVHRGRAGPRAHRPHQAHRPRCRVPAARRAGGRGPARHPLRGGGRRRRLPLLATTRKDSVRQPDYSRRVVVTGLGVISPVGNDKDTAWANLLNGVSGLREITRFDTSTVHPQVGRRGARLRRHGRGWTPRPSAAASPRCGTASPPRSRRSPTPASRSRTPTARTSASCSAPGAGGQTLMIENWEVLKEKGPNRVAPTFIANGLVDSTSGMIAIETGAIGTNMCIVTACSTGTNCVGEGGRAHPARRRPHGHRGLDRDAAARGRARRVRQHARHGLAPRGRAGGRHLAPVRPVAATGSCWARAAAALILEDLELAKARGAHIYAEVVGYGSAADG